MQQNRLEIYISTISSQCELSISRPHKVHSIKKVLMSGTRKKMEERLENARRLVNEDPERL